MLKLHIIIEPFYGLLRNLVYLSKQSKWINQNKELGFNDFFTWNRDRNKRLNLYTHLNSLIIKDNPINYLEFGVANGSSFYWWLENHTNPDSYFHGFDTFSGLPEDWGHFKKGEMNNGNEILKTEDKRALFYQGLFQQTLPGFLKTFQNDRLTVIHIDADLYSSTLYTLTSLAPYLKKGDIIFFDEFCVPTHEFLAFKNFTESYYIDLKPVAASNNYLFTAFVVN
ncbi:MAG TPA: class I SAM-dependent methyltransferase [Ferruginibacter sp.]|nr:class I SAM-dependent methyltransferase [Ferruginibacter sp.]HMP22408.1 class I SAM-dependent methyltransferase [Ferruginibacter sp.]